MSHNDRTAGPRVLVADASAPTRAGLRAAIEPHGFVVAAQAADARGAIECVWSERPDACILSLALPGGGAGTISAILDVAPATAIIALADHASEDDVTSATAAGAIGFVTRGDALGRVPVVLSMVLEGYAALPARMLTRVAERAARERRRPSVPGRARALLSPREREVLDELREGASTQEIADQLGLSAITVRRYVSGAMRKSGVASRAELIEILDERRAS